MMGIKLQAQQQLNFSSLKSLPLILQAEIARSGLAAIAIDTSFYGHQLDMLSAN